jgi:hypothetical protein
MAGSGVCCCAWMNRDLGLSDTFWCNDPLLRRDSANGDDLWFGYLLGMVVPWFPDAKGRPLYS